MSPYTTVGKLKNLRITQDDIEAQKKNLDVLTRVELRPGGGAWHDGSLPVAGGDGALQ